MFKKYLKSKSIDFWENNIAPFVRQINSTAGTDERTMMLVSKILINDIKNVGILKNISDAEFKVCSQFGDDGIIQYLIQRVDIKDNEHNFVEFGVENYRESNTRFLLMNNNWRGLVMDGNKNYINTIKKRRDYWKYNLTSAAAFVTQKNINNLFEKYGFSTNLGILSIDVDGNDYWLWKAFTITKPAIVIIEYNSIFGPEKTVTIPYREDFYRTKAHHSNLYWGSSLNALVKLGKDKGYVFVGSNSNGNNAYFINKDRLGKLKRITAEKGYVESMYRESRDEKGNLVFVNGKNRFELIENMNVFDISKNKVVKLKEA